MTQTEPYILRNALKKCLADSDWIENGGRRIY